ncbi:cytochrome c oxidase assembly protein [Arthrobacter alpinus]|nr:cytochrome c oxidase assembly protein [Arthrobacter alpinus]
MVVAILLYPALYLTDVISIVMRIPFGHDALLFIFLVLGVISAIPLWSSDPLPRVTSFAVRFVDIVVELQIHAVFGLILLESGHRFSAHMPTPPATMIRSSIRRSPGP